MKDFSRTRTLTITHPAAARKGLAAGFVLLAALALWGAGTVRAYGAVDAPSPVSVGSDWVRPDQYKPRSDAGDERVQMASRGAARLTAEDIDEMTGATPWQSLGEAEASGKNGKTPVVIRLAPMPGSDMQAVPDVRISKPRFEDMKPAPQPAAKIAEKAPAKTVEKKKPEATAEACNALTDMRRRQLEAIESDRRTLAALRQALAETKMGSKLQFIAEQAKATDADSLAAVAAEVKIRNP